MNFLSTIVVAGGNGGDILRSLFFLLIIGIVLGILYWLVNAAPFINAMFKQVLGWLIIGFGALILINALLGLVGHPLVAWN